MVNDAFRKIFLEFWQIISYSWNLKFFLLMIGFKNYFSEMFDTFLFFSASLWRVWIRSTGSARNLHALSNLHEPTFESAWTHFRIWTNPLSNLRDPTFESAWAHFRICTNPLSNLHEPVSTVHLATFRIRYRNQRRHCGFWIRILISKHADYITKTSFGFGSGFLDTLQKLKL